MLAETALETIRSGRAPLVGGQCLAYVRLAIETEYKLQPYALYKILGRYNAALDGTRTAYQAEIAFANAGFSVHGPVKHGDIVFARVSMPAGHVGIVYFDPLRGMCVLENTTARDRQRYYGYPSGNSPNCISLLRNWDTVSSIVRLPPNFGQ